MRQRVELVCPAGSLPALKAAVDNGADAVYIGFRDGTNARNFPGLGFSAEEAALGVDHAHARGAQVLVALNTYPDTERWRAATAALATAASVGADAVILADPGLMAHAVRVHPDLRLHLSVQGSATNRHAIAFYHRHFGVRRVVLPRVLSLAQVLNLVGRVPVEIEVFCFGSLCVMVEGRCALSAYVTGKSPNVHGVCSPASAVRWEETPAGRQSRVGGMLIDRYQDGQPAAYPTICKGRYRVGGHVYYAIEEPTSLNVVEILPELVLGGVAALKVEGRQRGPAYVARVTKVLRAALDACCADPARFVPRQEWLDELNSMAEGRCHTLGAYHRPWQ
ncbi:MAG: putative protease YhbU [Gammaproteobacteria bacterium]|nr:putative protease YhbU [Gammaproteobacteria bacterium]